MAYLKRPYAEKGLIIGTFDLLLKLFALCVWGYLAVILCTLFFDSMLMDYNPVSKMWWFSYCFLIFSGALGWRISCCSCAIITTPKKNSFSRNRKKRSPAGRALFV